MLRQCPYRERFVGAGISLLVVLILLAVSGHAHGVARAGEYTADIVPDGLPRELVIIDPGVVDTASLAAQLRPGVETVILSPDRPAVEQIGRVLASRHGLDAVHLISHGAPGQLSFARGRLSLADLERYHAELAAWGGALKKHGDLLVYGCNVAEGPDGVAFVHELARLTGANVAASSDRTGPVSDSANTDLEVATGEISVESVIPPSAAFIPLYSQLLDWTGWTAGTLTHTYQYTNLDGLNIDVVATSAGDTARYAIGSPSNTTDGLRHRLNYTNRTQSVTFTVSFYACTRAVEGNACVPAHDAAHALPVYIRDLTIKNIDSGGTGTGRYQDQVTLSSTTAAGATHYPDLIQLYTNSTVIVPAPVAPNTRANIAYATNGTSFGVADQRGWATLTYRDTAVRSFAINYGSGPNAGTNPNQQTIWISNFTFASSNSGFPTHAVVTSFHAESTSAGAVVGWGTGSEVGTAGFHVDRFDDGSKRFVRVNDELIPSVGAGQGGTYRLIDPSAVSGSTYRYRLEEVELSGERRRYGPFEVTVDGPGYGRIALESRNMTPPAKSAWSAKAHPPEAAKREAALVREKARHEALQALQQSGSATALKIAVREDGLYFMSSAEIAQALALPESNIQWSIRNGRMRLRNRGRDVAWTPAEGSTGLYFYGQAIDSPFTRDNVYWLRRGIGPVMGREDGGKPAPAPPGQVFTDIVSFEEDLLPGTSLASDPYSDYWYWKQVIAGHSTMGTARFDLPLAGVEGDSGVLRIRCKGVGFAGYSAAYHIAVSLNEQAPVETSWNGADSVTLDLQATGLRDGLNTLAITGLPDPTPGAGINLFFIDSIEIGYSRRYEAVNGSRTVQGAGNAGVTVSGFTDAAVRVFDVSDPLRPNLVDNTTIDSEAGSRVSFLPATPDARYLVVDSSAIKAPARVTAYRPTTYKTDGIDADYLIVAPPEFVEASRSLADLRRASGLKPAVVSLEDIYDEFGQGIASPDAISSFLRRMYRLGNGQLRYVVLMGDGSFDYRNLQGYGDCIVPPWMAHTPDGLFASDMGYGDINNDGVPEFIVSRLPVDGTDQILAYVGKLAAREASLLDTVLVVGDDPDSAGNFPADADAISRMLPQGVPQAQILMPSYANVADARAALIAQLRSGVGFIDYIGHGAVYTLASRGLLAKSDIPNLGNTGLYPVVAALTCFINRFELPGIDSLGEMLVRSPSSGAVAVFSAAGLSLNDRAEPLNENLLRAIYDQGETILGDAILAAVREYARRNASRDLLRVYNLLGDPAVRLDVPTANTALLHDPTLHPRR